MLNRRKKHEEYCILKERYKMGAWWDKQTK